MWMMHGYPFYDGGMGFGVFGVIFWFFFILFVVWLISLFFRSERHEDHEDDMIEEESALEILKKRYARGEITKRQFIEMKKDIG